MKFFNFDRSLDSSISNKLSFENNWLNKKNIYIVFCCLFLLRIFTLWYEIKYNYNFVSNFNITKLYICINSRKFKNKQFININK